MTFKVAMKRLRKSPTRPEVAKEIGVSFASVEQAMLPRSSPAHRPEPAGWEKAIARMARRRAAELLKLADQLDAGVD